MLQLSRAELLRSYREMRTIRAFEEAVHIACQDGEIPGFVHLSAGQEAAAVGVCIQLSNIDQMVSTHRGHGHSIAKGCDVVAMMKEVFGKAGGLCGGKGGSMHLADFGRGALGTNGINAAGLPLACGAALSAKYLHTGGIAVAFAGDGASNQGTAFESLNLAVVWKLPVVFVFENNGYAESTAVTSTIPDSAIARRAEGFGIPTETIDGSDFFEVYDGFLEAADRARSGMGPSLLELKLHRWYGHFEGDRQTYRGSGEVERLRATKDCLVRFRQRVTETGLLDVSALDEVDEEVAELIERALVQAKAAPFPISDDLLTNVYTTY